MGLFEKLFPKPKIVSGEQYQLLNGYTPQFQAWGGSEYESELVRASVDARARHISKLKVEIKGAAKPTLQTKLKQGPNEWQTWGQFLYRLSTILDMKNTAFIIPIIDIYGETTGVYAVCPKSYSLTEYEGTTYLRMQFGNGKTQSIELAKVGIMTKFQYRNDLFGESNEALTPTMELLDIQNQGIKEGVKSSATYRFMATMNNFVTDDDLAKERARFNNKNFRRGLGGILLFPNTYKDAKQITSRPYVADAGTMKMIETRVFNYFGVNEDVLQNKTYGDSWNAFYEGAIEPFAIQFSEVISRMLFTLNERNRGNFIMATANRLQYMSTRDKLNVSVGLSDRGELNRDEVREIWNMPPLPNGEGEEYIIRGEYYNASDKINAYDDDNEGEQDNG